MQGTLLAAVLVLIALVAAVVTISGIWWLTPAATEWHALDSMMFLTTLVAGLAFIIVHLVVAYTILRFRRREGRRAAHFADNPRLETLLIVVTALGIVAMLVPGLGVYARTVAPPQDAILVEVLAEQWAWSFRYPGDDGVLGRVHPQFVTETNLFGIDPADPAGRDDRIVARDAAVVPVGRPVHFRLRSQDVLHNFWVPEFRVKMDAVPGIVTDLWVTPTRTGTFQIVCAEYCGVGHYVMRGEIEVADPAAFASWLEGLPTAQPAATGE